METVEDKMYINSGIESICCYNCTYYLQNVSRYIVPLVYPTLLDLTLYYRIGHRLATTIVLVGKIEHSNQQARALSSAPSVNLRPHTHPIHHYYYP